MYLTVDTKDVVLAIIFLIGLMLFSKWKPKNVSGFNGVFNYLIDSRKMIASYVAAIAFALILVTITSSSGLITSFLSDKISTTSSASDTEFASSTPASFNPPNLSKLLNRNNTDDLITYLQSITTQNGYYDS